MTITVPGGINLLAAVLLVLLLILVLVRSPRPAGEWALPRILYLVAFICFILAAVGLAAFPWLPIGLACWVGAILAG